MVRDIVGGSGSSFPGWLTVVGQTLFFTALNDKGFELWRSDGTASGTRPVADIVPGSVGSNPGNLVAVDGLLYFTANDGATGVELWQSDGTEIGTRLVREIYPGPPGALPHNLAAANGHLFLAADSPPFGIEPWSVPAASAPLTLQIEVDGLGTGLVTSRPEGIQCGADCAETFDLGTSVDVFAVPDYESKFWGWDGDPDCEDGRLTIDANKTCQVTFSPCLLDSIAEYLGSFTVTSLQHFEACNELRAGDGFTVKPGGDARFRAGNLIVLENDFTVESGGALEAKIGPQ
jgi:ELWxxDGT repeat protein